VGYCGGKAADPTYAKVCRDPLYKDYVEAIQIDFDPSLLSYTSLLDVYFDYDGGVKFPRAGGKEPHRMSSSPPVARRRASPKRQYAPVLFAHNDAQRAAAKAALAKFDGGIPTGVEDVYQASGTSFWNAEPYHQKWMLQKRRELMLALALPNEQGLLERAATVLNAFAGGALDATATRQRLQALVERGLLGEGPYEAVLDVLLSKPASAPGSWHR